MELFIHTHTYIPHHSHSPNGFKGVIAIYIIFNVIMIGLVVTRSLIWLLKKENKKETLFEYAIFQKNALSELFVITGSNTFIFITINAIPILLFLVEILIPYL